MAILRLHHPTWQNPDLNWLLPSKHSISRSVASLACSAFVADTKQCAMTISSDIVETFVEFHHDAVNVPLDDNGLFVQVLPTFADLARASKLQYAAFIASEKMLVVWDDEPMHIIARAEKLEKKLTSVVLRDEKDMEESGEKKGPHITVAELDEETGRPLPQERPTHLMNTVLVGLTLALITTVLGAGFRQIAIEVAVDHNMIRLAFVALTPIQVFFTLVRCSLALTVCGMR